MEKVGIRNTEWMKQIPHVAKGINESYTRMIGVFPVKAITKENPINQNFISNAEHNLSILSAGDQV